MNILSNRNQRIVRVAIKVTMTEHNDTNNQLLQVLVNRAGTG